MRIIFAILIVTTISLTAYSQKTDLEKATNAVRYRLFPTQNMWTFIKLDTRSGQMWQVTYDVQGDNRNEVYLNLEPLVNLEHESNGRFTLYPTENIYTFILLDQSDGKVWQVQWSMEAKNRGVLPIK